MIYTAEIKCKSCGKSFIIEKPTQGQLNSSIAKIRFCPECRAIRRAEGAKKYNEAVRTGRTPYVREPNIVKLVDEGYRRFWAKRGIDVSGGEDPFGRRITTLHD